MANYKLTHTGEQIDEAVGNALTVKVVETSTASAPLEIADGNGNVVLRIDANGNLIAKLFDSGNTTAKCG